MEQKFEYKAVKIEAELEELEKALNGYGDEGWCLQSIDRIGGQQLVAGTGNDITAPIYNAIFMKAVMPELDMDSLIQQMGMGLDEDDFPPGFPLPEVIEEETTG
jgi:hypothetical protein